LYGPFTRYAYRGDVSNTIALQSKSGRLWRFVIIYLFFLNLLMIFEPQLCRRFTDKVNVRGKYEVGGHDWCHHDIIHLNSVYKKPWQIRDITLLSARLSVIVARRPRVQLLWHVQTW
jgi:hypothetical protein